MSDQHLNFNDEAQGPSEDETLRFVQGVRRQLVEKATANGIPDDQKERTILLTALSDMDRQALGVKKIGAKERSGAADRLAALTLAKMIQSGGANGLLGGPEPIEGQLVRQVPTLDGVALPSLELLPGETEIGIATENYDAFMERMEGK